MPLPSTPAAEAAQAPARQTLTLKHRFQQPQVLRPPAASDFVGISVPEIRAKVRRGEFPAPIKLGRRAIAWRIEDLEKFLASRPTVGTATSPEEAQAAALKA